MVFFIFFYLSLFLPSPTHPLTISSNTVYQDLQSSTEADFIQEIVDWQILDSVSPYYTMCQGYPMLGGWKVGGTFSRTYTSLPSHTRFTFSMKLHIVDDWVWGDSLTLNLDSFSLKLDQIGRKTASSSYWYSTCGDWTVNDLGYVYVRGIIAHNSSSLNISFTPNMTWNNATRQSWGLREVNFRFYEGNDTEQACFIPIWGYTSSFQCECQDIYQFKSIYGCQGCPSGCYGCFGTCITCQSGYGYNGNACYGCPSNCQSCSNSTYCTKCNSGMYLLKNGQCASSCPAGMLNTSSPSLSCYSPCTTGEYVYWDGTCNTTCPSPYTNTSIGPDLVCSWPCQNSQYLYWDNQCDSSCAFPLTNSSFKERKFCWFPCDDSTPFLYSNGSCMAQCVSPLVNKTVHGKVMCVLPCSPGNYLYQNGQCASTCPSPYHNYTIGEISYCDSPCNTTEYYYDNKTCIASCPAPFQTVASGVLTYCRCGSSTPYYNPYTNSCVASCTGVYGPSSQNGMLVCNITCLDFLYSNNSCLNTCNIPFTNRTNGIIQFCDFACSSGSFLYYNNSCVSPCPPLYTQKNIGVEKYCYPSCTQSQFVLSTGSCSNTCNSPLLPSTSFGYNFCTNPCTNPSFPYPLHNGTCVASCNSPWFLNSSYPYPVCETPCNSTVTPYALKNGSCVASCTSPWYIVTNDYYLLCNTPCTDPSFPYSLQNGTCVSSCSSPWILNNNAHYPLCINPCTNPSLPYPLTNGTCIASCSSPWFISTNDYYPTCRTPCSSLSSPYSLQNATCISNCSFPWQLNSTIYPLCQSPCLNPSLPFPLANGTCVPSCHSPWHITTSDLYPLCDTRCLDSNSPYSLQNGSCVKYCTSPWELSLDTYYPLCSSRCTDPSKPYSLLNSTCVASCPSPWIIDHSNYYSVCDNPCTDPAFPYALLNGSCVATCDSQYYTASNEYYPLCMSICKDPEFPYPLENGTCVANCTSPSGFLNTSYYFPLCQRACSDSSLPFILRNGTCVSNCTSPWHVNNAQYPLCDSQCADNEYFTSSGACSSNCLAPFVPAVGSFYLYCSTPCSDPTPYLRKDTLTCAKECYPPYVEDQNSMIPMCELMKAVQTGASSVSNTGTSGAAAAASVQGTVGSASGGGVSAFGLVTLNRFLYYTRFLLINYPENLREYYVAANNTAAPSLGVTLPQDGIEFPPYKPIPYAFEGWGLQSSFIANYWSTLSTILVAIVLGQILWMAQRFFEKIKKKYAAFFFEKLTFIFRWNFALIVFCTGYDSIMLYAFCEFRTYTFENYMSILSFVSALLAFGLAFYFLILTWKLAKLQERVKKIAKIRNSNMDTVRDLDENTPLKVFMRKWQGFQILFTGYKDNTAFARGFIFFFMLRNMAWIWTLALLYEYPLAQIIIMCFLSYLMLFMMLVKRPFVNLVSKFEIPCIELINSYVNTCILVLAIMDKAGIENQEMRNTLGSAIIFGFTAFGMVGMICMVGYFILGTYIGVKKYRQMKAAGSLTFISLLTVPFVSYGMDFDEFETKINKKNNLVIKEDAFTKELSIVKIVPFNPVAKLQRKETDDITCTTEKTSPFTMRKFISDSTSSRKDSFQKSVIIKQLLKKSNQVMPMPETLNLTSANSYGPDSEVLKLESPDSMSSYVGKNLTPSPAENHELLNTSGNKETQKDFDSDMNSSFHSVGGMSPKIGVNRFNAVRRMSCDKHFFVEAPRSSKFGNQRVQLIDNEDKFSSAGSVWKQENDSVQFKNLMAVNIEDSFNSVKVENHLKLSPSQGSSDEMKVESNSIEDV